MKHFDEIYKHGLKPVVPANINKEVYDEWVDGQKVIFQKENEGNYLVACIYDEDGEDKIIYSFMRFFNLGTNTECSIDFQSSSQKQMIEKLTEMLSKRHTF